MSSRSSPSGSKRPEPRPFAIPPRGLLYAELKKRDLLSLGRLLHYLPRAYRDRRIPTPLAFWPPGTDGFAPVRIDHVAEVPISGRPTLRISFSDGTGRAEGVFFHYRPWMKKSYAVGQQVYVSGVLQHHGDRREIIHPEIEPIGSAHARDRASYNRIVPIYPAFERHQRALCALMLQAFETGGAAFVDPLPESLRLELGLPTLRDALRELHFPQEMPREDSLARRRLVFDEFFALQLGYALSRAQLKREPGIGFRAEPEQLDKAWARLPFPPTGAQRRALEEIAGDMRAPEPMNRLLQGDVGSGKTAVMGAALGLALDNGFQGAVMAPTELLARQHFQSLSHWFGDDSVAFLAGGRSRGKAVLLRQIAAGEVPLVVGTHALIQEHVTFAKLGFVAIDEQHRFGVLQRSALLQKGARMPDLLLMTATPIPRTLQMSSFGDLDVSILDELPPGRTPIKTFLLPARKRDKVHAAIDRILAQHEQVYVIYPLVEETETSDLDSAVEGASALAARFPDHRVGLVHGRMKPEEKDAVMESFRRSELHLLVSTTVIEVGVDVPNATAIVIESADRFGLSQLHQLRGRVGRGSAQSRCYLISQPHAGWTAQQRLAILEQTQDGFRIAEADLALRGPGEFLGTRQSGTFEFGVADLLRDADLLTLARNEATRLFERDPNLSLPEHRLLRESIFERWGERLQLGHVG